MIATMPNVSGNIIANISAISSMACPDADEREGASETEEADFSSTSYTSFTSYASLMLPTCHRHSNRYLQREGAEVYGRERHVHWKPRGAEAHDDKVRGV